MSDSNTRRLPDYQAAPLQQRAATIDWARENGLDPARILADSLEIDLGARLIRYQEHVEEGAPGAWRPNHNSPWQRTATAPLLTDPPPAMFGRPAPRYIPPADHDWTRYERTCAPDRQLDGLGDLCLFLGGTWAESPRAASFIGVLLMLIEKGQSSPEWFHQLALAFPREVTAWLVWRSITDHSPTAAELCALLIANDQRRAALYAVAAVPMPDGFTITNTDIWGPEDQSAGQVGS